MKTGVVVSGYGMPSAIRLQARAIKAFSGSSAALAVWDDCSCWSAEVFDVCRAEGCHYLGTGESWGHAGGYLAGLYSGLQWAIGLRLDTLAVVSQRYVITSPGWLAGLSPVWIAANEGEDVTGYRYLHTSLIALDVPPWKPHVEAVRPRRLRGKPAEAFLYDVVALAFGESEPLPSVQAVDYRQASLYDFQRLARSLDVTLWKDFHLDYWRDRPAYDCG